MDLVVLTWLASSLWATTCEEYISKVWPKYTNTIGKTFQWLQRSPRRRTNLLCSLGPHDTFELLPQPGEDHCFTKKGWLFSMKARLSHCAPVLEAMTWLCGVLRTSSSDMIEESVLSLDDISEPDSPKFRISLRPTASVSPLHSGCWKPLFPQAVTAP